LEQPIAAGGGARCTPVVGALLPARSAAVARRGGASGRRRVGGGWPIGRERAKGDGVRQVRLAARRGYRGSRPRL